MNAIPKRGLITLSGVLVLVVLAALLSGCVGNEPTFSYQGRLLSASGVPVADGSYNFTFGLFDTSSGGTALYTETKSVTVERGLFNTWVATSADPSIFREPLWLEVAVDPDGAGPLPAETLTPRQMLYGAPYASSLTAGAVIQGTVSIDRTLDGNADTGAGLAVFNGDFSTSGGHGLLVANSAVMDGTGGYFAGDSAALGAEARGNGYGAIIQSVDYRGMYVDGDSDAAAGAGTWYDAMFAGDVGIWVNGNCTGCTQAYIAQNEGSTPISPGDFVAVSGVAVDPDLHVPIILVHRAASADDPIVGVAERSMTRSDVRERYGWTTGGFDAGTGDAAPGEYLSVVVQGLVRARVSESATLSIGGRLSVMSEGAIEASESDRGLGTALSAPGEDGLAWILFTGR